MYITVSSGTITVFGNLGVADQKCSAISIVKVGQSGCDGSREAGLWQR